ncbi:MAG: hypothetical protein GY832_21890 [Chloroflexi bacterium]|nr:hypothetical protein [Chloroflexota bacterium]
MSVYNAAEDLLILLVENVIATEGTKCACALCEHAKAAYSEEPCTSCHEDSESDQDKVHFVNAFRGLERAELNESTVVGDIDLELREQCEARDRQEESLHKRLLHSASCLERRHNLFDVAVRAYWATVERKQHNGRHVMERRKELVFLRAQNKLLREALAMDEKEADNA